MDRSKLYICYSIPQRDFLTKNGLRWEISGKHMDTNNPFWAFIRTDKLDKLLKEWSQGK